MSSDSPPSRERCYLCGSESVTEKYARQGPSCADAAAFRCTSMDHASKPRVVACRACGLEYVPRSDIHGRLEDLYSEVVDERYLKHQGARRRTFESAWRKIEPFLPVGNGLRAGKGRLLEIGCYCGLFLEVARERGWQTVGIEPSRWAAEQARSRGLDVRQGTFESFQGEDGQFDAVAMWDVLEHVPDPLLALRHANRCLKPGGVLCLSTLDIDNWFPRLLGKRWPWLMDMHLFYFRRSLMAPLFRKAGLDLLRARTYCHWIAAEYLVEKAGSLLPRMLSPLARAAGFLVPSRMLVPFRFGDIKLYVARTLRA